MIPPNMFAVACLGGQTMVNEMVEKSLEQIKKTLVMPNVPTYGATLHATDMEINGWDI